MATERTIYNPSPVPFTRVASDPGACRKIVRGNNEACGCASAGDGIAEARFELATLADALLQLPPRQRAILIAARYEQIPRAEIAKRYNISRRLVQAELQRALETCKNYLDSRNA